MKLVQHLLESKGREIISVTADASVLDAIILMAERGIGSLLVMSGDQLQGIVTERDYARKVIVKATIVVPDGDEDDALRIIEKNMTLSLEKKGSQARLKAEFKNGLINWGSSGYIKLEVKVPQGMSVDIDDGSGSIDVIDVAGDVTINDGSGSIEVRNVANLKIDDGSGSIDVVTASGDVFIEDGSGSISVKHVAGSVTVDDGSGGINVSDVENDLIIVDDGSGSLNHSDIRGSVDQET
jgi:CBS domain-containing protein